MDAEETVHGLSPVAALTGDSLEDSRGPRGTKACREPPLVALSFPGWGGKENTPLSLNTSSLGFYFIGMGAQKGLCFLLLLGSLNFPAKSVELDFYDTY